MSASVVANKKLLRNGCASSKSSESLCSASSVNSKTRVLHRRTQSSFISLPLPNSGDIRQRVLSARQHRFRTLQNKLNEVLQENASLINENRLMKTLHKRQDNALAKYEHTSADLPQLLNSHTQELHMWQTKYRTLNIQHRELNKRILQKDKTINELSDRIKHLKQLTENKNLEERDTLTNKVRSLERQLDEKDEEIKMLTRRNHLEAKNFKVQLANANRKYKELCQKSEWPQTKRHTVSSNDSQYNSAKNATEAKQNHTFILNVNGSMPTMDAETREYSENGRPTLFMKNAGSETSQESSRNEDNDNNDSDADDDDLIIKTMIDQDRKNSQNDSRQLEEFFKHLNLNGKDSMQNIKNIQEKINDDIEANEVLLDLHCGEISESLGNVADLSVSGSLNVDRMGINTNRTHIPRPIPSSTVTKSVKRAPIDPQKKSSLLAALRSIDSMK